MLNGLDRYIATIETSKHRFFVFLDGAVAPDNMLIALALNDPYFLGLLSSSIHLVWVEANAGSLGMYKGNVRYNKTRCFEPFPFPDATEAQKAHIRALAEQLDAHRKRQQAQHPSLTLTDMYNVLEKVRALDLSGGAPPDRSPAIPLTAKEKQIHEQGLVAILKQLHDD